ncbi:hypothetical protein YC2023_005331 [Brassica napus]
MRSFLRFNLDTSFLSIVVFGEFIVDDKRGDEVKKFWLRNIFVLLCSRFTKLQEEIVRPRSGDAAPFVVKPTLKMNFGFVQAFQLILEGGLRADFYDVSEE